ncbi:MAG: hypothetical protein K2M91_09600 [Lachnospiraceae bacterium]|nr:hypothetical protein [Lachnospiraceae bacterium]
MEEFRPFQEELTEKYTDKSYESVRKFGYSLFAQSMYDKNPVLSPVSAYLVLTLTGCGAYGATKEEFYNVLGRDMIVQTIDMMQTIPTKGDFLSILFANSAWMDVKYFLNDTWMSAIKCLMNAEVFQTSLFTIETMKIMNHWIEMKTNKMIVNALEEPLDLQTNFALFNTIYFKGNWVHSFMDFDTHKEAFCLNKGQNVVVQADMMKMNEQLDYISDDLAEGVILPYQSNHAENFAFLALKPKGNESIRSIGSRLNSRVIKDILANRQNMEIELKLPKFAISYDRNLNKSLINMGLMQCFDMKRADLTRISKKLRNGDRLYIDFVRQKAKIIVDENGTEAAAATGLLGALSASSAQKNLYFNEPFLYMIMDMDKEIPLFVGILDNPLL